MSKRKTMVIKRVNSSSPSKVIRFAHNQTAVGFHASRADANDTSQYQPLKLPDIVGNATANSSFQIEKKK